VTTPVSGWYQDPADPSDPEQFRWWNGIAWSEETRRRVPPPVGPTPAPTPLQAPLPNTALYEPDARAYVPMSGYTPRDIHVETAPSAPLSRKEKDRERRQSNPMAYTGLLLSLVGMLFNPLALLSILGLVFSAVGLASSYRLESLGARTTGRGTAGVGIALGVVGVALFLWLIL